MCLAYEKKEKRKKKKTRPFPSDLYSEMIKPVLLNKKRFSISINHIFLLDECVCVRVCVELVLNRNGKQMKRRIIKEC